MRLAHFLRRPRPMDDDTRSTAVDALSLLLLPLSVAALLAVLLMHVIP